MVNLKPSPGPATEQADKFANLENALTTLAGLPPNTKIHIIDREKLQIVPETRYGITRALWGWWSGDGCKPTMDLICQIMDECISFASLIDESSDKNLRERKERLKKLLPPALQSMGQIRELYSSPKEKEYEAAHQFAIKINVYVTGVSHLVGDVNRELIPAPTQPGEIPHVLHAIPTKLIAGVALPVIFCVGGTVAFASKALTIITFVGEVADFANINGNVLVSLSGISTASSAVTYCMIAKSAIEKAGKVINYFYIFGRDHPKLKLMFNAVRVMGEI